MAIGDNTKHGKILAEWQVPEYIRYAHSVSWYIFMGIVAAIFLVQAILSLNFLFIIIILLIASIVFLHERGTPEMLDFLIVEDGIVLGERFYAYKDLNEFWIIYEPPEVQILYFGLRQTFRHDLPIHLEDQNPVTIRQILLNHLEENIEKEEEATEERLARMLQL